MAPPNNKCWNVLAELQGTAAPLDELDAGGPPGVGTERLRTVAEKLLAKHDRNFRESQCSALSRDVVCSMLAEGIAELSQQESHAVATAQGHHTASPLLRSLQLLMEGQSRVEAKLDQIAARVHPSLPQLSSGDTPFHNAPATKGAKAPLEPLSTEDWLSRASWGRTPTAEAGAGRGAASGAAPRAAEPSGAPADGIGNAPSPAVCLPATGGSGGEEDCPHWLKQPHCFDPRPELHVSREEVDRACEQGVANLRQAESMSDEHADRTSSIQMGSTSSRGLCGWSRMLLFAPTSTVRLALDLISMVVLAYDLLSVPYQVAWDIQQEGRVLYLQVASACYWVLDILANFRTGFYAHGELVMRPSTIARHYMKGPFWLDSLIVLVDIFAVAILLLRAAVFDLPNGLRLLRIVKVSRVTRLISILRMFRLADAFDRLYMISSVLHDSVVFVLNTFSMAAVIVWLNHVIACSWYALGKSERFSDTGINWLDTHAGNGHTYGELGPWYQYTTSLHWSLTQMTPGSMQVFPVNAVERLFNVFCLLSGLIVFSFLISSISATVTQFKIKIQHHAEKLDLLQRFLRTTRISSELALQVNEQVVQRLGFRKPLTAQDVDVLGLLSLSLHRTLMVEIYRPTLSVHGFFRFLLEMDIHCAEELCRNCSELLTMARADTLFMPEEQAQCMYFVSSGQVDYTFDHNPTPSQIHRALSHSLGEPKRVGVGKWLCEATLWCHWRHVGFAENRGAAPCELLSVRTDKLTAMLKMSPIVHSIAWAYASSFCASLAVCRPPRNAWPNDVDIPFGVDEVMSAMPHSAKVFLGEVAICVLRSSRSWLASLSYGQFEQLQSEVQDGRSFLMLTPDREKVLRVVSLVALRLRRSDGRCLARLRLTDSAGEATCKLPGSKLHAGETSDEAAQRLLREQLAPVMDQIALLNFTREEDFKKSDKLGVPTRYVRLVVDATWQAEEPAGWSSAGGPAPSPPSSPPQGRSTVEPRVPSRWSSSSPSSRARLGREAEVFTILDGQYAWLREEDFDNFQSATGRGELAQWMASVQERAMDLGSSLASLSQSREGPHASDG